MNNNTCKECNEVFNTSEQVRRHLRKHQITYQQYFLKWNCDGIIPKCKCGCGKDTSWHVAKKSYTDFVHGHHAYGRVKSEDEKQKIGRANSINMKRYMKEHPDIALAQGHLLRNCITPEIEAKRIEATKHAYALMKPKDKQKFSDNAKKLWKNGDKMKIAHEKSAATFNERIANGHYDFAERNNKLSISITNKYLEGGFEWSRGSHVSIKTGKTYHYRSSWERQYMEKLDADPGVITWNYEFDVLFYVSNGKVKRYIPDFLVSYKDKIEFVEIKPVSLRETIVNNLKRQSAIEYCKLKCYSYLEWSP